MSNALASQCGGTLASTYNLFKEKTGTAKCHIKELAAYRLNDPRFARHRPRVFDIYEDENREAYVLILEYMEDKILMDTVDDIHAFGREAIEAALSGAASLHSVFYDRCESLRTCPWIGTVPTHEHMVEMIPLWEALSVHMMREFADWFDMEDRRPHRGLIQNIGSWWREIDAMPHTFIHNDFNPRNICFEKEADGSLKLLAYDWELATLHIPQHDLAELLAFTLTSAATSDEIDHYVEYHRGALEQAAGCSIDPVQWRRGYRLSLWDLAVNRTAIYLMGHTFRHYSFMERVITTLRHLIMEERRREG